jgi:ABC-2 type transport system permease protein
MAAAETSGTPVRKTRVESRRAERAPSGGWRTIAAKELADHIASWRFFVLLLVIGVLSVLPMYFSASDVQGQAAAASGNPLAFLVLFTHGASSFGGVAMITLVTLLVPLVGISFGFDGINSERSQGTLSRLLAQPVHRDDVVNGKFAAGIFVITVMMLMLVLLVTSIGILRLGIIPQAEDLARVGVWFIATVLYASFWLAFALLLSTVIRSAATAALVGFGTWLGVTMVGGFLLPAVASFLFPIDATASISSQFGSAAAQNLLLRLSPAQLYSDILQAVMDPRTKAILISNVGQATASQEQIPNLLSLDQSILLVWPQFVALVALTVLLFAIAYVLFLRQEVRA